MARSSNTPSATEKLTISWPNTTTKRNNATDPEDGRRMLDRLAAEWRLVHRGRRIKRPFSAGRFSE